MNAAMGTQHFPAAAHQFAGSIGKRVALLSQVRIKKLLVVAAGHEADFLRVRLVGQGQAMTARDFSHLGLQQPAQGKERAAELLLGEAKEEVSLVARGIYSALEQPAAAGAIKLNARVVAGGQALSANLPRGNQQLIKLQVIVA